METTILIVDDERNNLDLMRATLRDEGFRLIFAKDGEKALQQVLTHSPNLILLDIMMPKMDGYEACRQLKADEKTLLVLLI